MYIKLVAYLYLGVFTKLLKLHNYTQTDQNYQQSGVAIQQSGVAIQNYIAPHYTHIYFYFILNIF